MTGTGLGAILFGPSAVSILGIIVLIYGSFLCITPLNGCITFDLCPFCFFILFHPAQARRPGRAKYFRVFRMRTRQPG